MSARPPQAPPDAAFMRAARLRRDAERAAGALPPLLVEARRLAAAVSSGAHGRRRAGAGEAFWQYRRAMPGDPASAVDWRRSARSDQLFVRETEWESPQSVWLWADDAASMSCRSAAAPRAKRDRAALLALALAALVIRGGERAALLGAGRPGAGEAQLRRMAAALAAPPVAEDARPAWGAPPAAAWTRGGTAVFLSDFLGPLAPVEAALRAAAAAGVGGVCLQILDPAEEAFPFDGRVDFLSPDGAMRHDAHRAESLREAYRRRLAERRARLRDAARRSGWQFGVHRTDQSARAALVWLHGAVAARRERPC
ncbi:DUF58 domain-containing protein [Oceanicella actignis]|uniref:DUF58 domain-containing protein n=1 Tax=Oceanicella actignis TaxID=1189325 RepID=UPI001251161C|nr:uncharacterized protein DUF58 [Oceanicella actignis]